MIVKLLKYYFVAATLSACSLTIDDPKPAQLIVEYGEQLEYANMVVRRLDEQPEIMVLGLAERSSVVYPKSIMLKWVSSDRRMLVTQAGRITKTLFQNNLDLYEVRSISADPLALGLGADGVPKVYNFVASWSGSDDIAAISTFRPSGEVGHWFETVRYATGHQVVNQYWLDASGAVIRSVQTPIPTSKEVKFSVVKPFGGQQ